MHREASAALDRWLAEPRRLPLVIRGARQVGKTWLVRDLAVRHGLDLVECNFERDPSLVGAFASNDPRRAIGEVGLALGRTVDLSNALLFLDEIQAAGDVLAKLRWFAEGLPELPVIAAGSLLEFTLAEHGFSMPVGRVSYMHLHPLSFPEYLRAHGQGPLVDVLQAWALGQDLGGVAHTRAEEWFARFVMVGGMPGVVRVDVDGGDARNVRRVQHDLLATYIDDFGKYAGRTDPALLSGILRSVAAQLGRKFVYSHVVGGARSERVRHGLELLTRARVCHLVEHTAANGLPLGGEVNPRNRKVILLDIGMLQALLGTPATQAFPMYRDLAPPVRGAMTEQVVGQHLFASAPYWEEPRLYYWQRGGGRPGEIDYVTRVDHRVVPIEAKSGAAGSMKSLHQFMHDKRLTLAVRLDSNPPTLQNLTVRTTQGDPVEYRLLSLPHFLVWRLADAVRSVPLAPAP